MSSWSTHTGLENLSILPGRNYHNKIAKLSSSQNDLNVNLSRFTPKVTRTLVKERKAVLDLLTEIEVYPDKCTADSNI